MLAVAAAGSHLAAGAAAGSSIFREAASEARRKLSAKPTRSPPHTRSPQAMVSPHVAGPPQAMGIAAKVERGMNRCMAITPCKSDINMSSTQKGGMGARCRPGRTSATARRRRKSAVSADRRKRRRPCSRAAASASTQAWRREGGRQAVAMAVGLSLRRSIQALRYWRPHCKEGSRASRASSTKLKHKIGKVFRNGSCWGDLGEFREFGAFCKS